jgi:hypothetical protein
VKWLAAWHHRKWHEKRGGGGISVMAYHLAAKMASATHQWVAKSSILAWRSSRRLGVASAAKLANDDCRKRHQWPAEKLKGGIWASA